MNLRKMIFWNTEPPVAAACTPAPTPVSADTLSNVIQLPLRNPLEQPAGLEQAAGSAEPTAVAATPPVPVGLMDTQELKAFFCDNFFGLGRHNGSMYRTQAALLQGTSGVVSRYQNIVWALVEQRQTKVDRLRNMALQTAGVCETTAAQLELACTRLERDMALLRDQIALAAENRGWVLDAVNRYRMGFDKGLREAIDFELLGS